ncbi:MAG: hypothetical protein OK449_02940 [Thaumarchaeota archaeon]|nr:hypothetical protein [Nitrososphaerota archaeon]
MERKNREDLLSLVEGWVVAIGQPAVVLAFFGAYSALLRVGRPRGRSSEAGAARSRRRNDISQPR